MPMPEIPPLGGLIRVVMLIVQRGTTRVGRGSGVGRIAGMKRMVTFGTVGLITGVHRVMHDLLIPAF